MSTPAAASPMEVAEPAGAAQPSAASVGAGGAAGRGEVEEGKVLQLVGMGFSRQQAEGVLASTGGDVEQAAALLLTQMEM